MTDKTHPPSPCERAFDALVVAVDALMKAHGRPPEWARPQMSGGAVFAGAGIYRLADGTSEEGWPGELVGDLSYSELKDAFVAPNGRDPARIFFDALWAMDAAILARRQTTKG